MLSLVTGCSVIEGTLSGYFVLKAQNPLDYGSALLNAAELSIIIKASTSYRRLQQKIQTCLESFCLSLPD